MQSVRNGRLFWPILVAIVVVDIVTKAIAVGTLAPQRVPRPDERMDIAIDTGKLHFFDAGTGIRL